MKSVCLSFYVHLPIMLCRYRFFDIGNEHYYHDDYSNETATKKASEESYLPLNELLLKLADKLKGKFKASFAITGSALEQFERYSPEVIESFKKLAKTGCVEFVSEPYFYTMSSLKNPDVFKKQVKLHEERIFDLFGQKPKTFSEMVYSGKTGALISEELQSANISMPQSILQAGEERSIDVCLGNDMQKEAYDKLHSLSERAEKCSDAELQKDWNCLQTSDHFYYMSTKDNPHPNPFNTPYEAFINYMNILSDFKIRLNSFIPEPEIDAEKTFLYKMIYEKNKKIKKLEAELMRLQRTL